MTSKINQAILYDRVQDLTPVDFQDLLCCICFDIVRQPIACGSCQNIFCSTCLNDWLSKPRQMCPMRCETFIQSECPESFIEQLGRVQITCIYNSKCHQIVDLKDLEKHEVECDFKPIQCSKCYGKIPQKYLVQHVNNCTKVREGPPQKTPKTGPAVDQRCHVCRNGNGDRSSCVRGGRGNFNPGRLSGKIWYFDVLDNWDTPCYCSCHK